MNTASYHLIDYVPPSAAVASVVSIFTGIATVVGVLVGVAATVYYILAIFQMEDVKKWRLNRAERRKARRIQELEAMHAQIVRELEAYGILTKANINIERGVTTRTVESVAPPITSKP